MFVSWVVMAAIVFGSLYVIKRWFLLDRDRPASASSAHEVFAALAWEIKGASVEGNRFEAIHRGRRIEIRARRGGYDIAIQGEPAVGSLSGPEALSLIKEASKTPLTLAAIPEWQALVQVFDTHPIRIEKGTLHAFAPSGGGVLGAVDEAARLERLLDRLVEVTGIAQLVHSLKTRAQCDTRCPYCHDAFQDTQRTIECARCGVKHHEECYAEFGQCAVFACATRHGVVPTISPQADAKQGFTR